MDPWQTCVCGGGGGGGGGEGVGGYFGRVIPLENHVYVLNP